MNNKYIKNFSRRKFIGILSSIPLFSFTFPSIYYFNFWKPRNVEALPNRQTEQNYRFFTQYQAAVVENMTSLIIPTDNGPGAREAGVVLKIDEIVSKKDNLKSLYNNGIGLIDTISKELFSKSNFLKLDSKEKLQILHIIDLTGTTAIAKAISSIDRRKKLFVNYFFNTLKNQSFELFYSSKLGWELVGYHGPPQWLGYPDYHNCSI